MSFTVEKVMLELSNNIPTYEYRLVGEFGNIVGVIYSEDLALRIKELLNNEE